METWKPVPGASWYEVSDQGGIRSLRSSPPRDLSPITNRDGYRRIRITTDTGAGRQVFVHRLILEAFVGPPPTGMLTRHLDGNPGNNTVANLRWGTYTENELDKLRHGTHHNAIKTHCPKGHPYDDENTRLRSKGRWRSCRACDRRQERAA